MEATGFWLTLLSGIAIGMLLNMSVRWIGRKLWGEKQQAIIVLCAWCGKEIHRDGIDAGVVVSHGICPECQEKHFPKSKVGVGGETENKGL